MFLVFHSHLNLKCSTCRLLHGKVYKNNVQGLLWHTSVSLDAWHAHFNFLCFSVCNSLRNTSISPAADSGWGTAVDQMWKWSVNGGGLKGRALTVSTSPLRLFLSLLEPLWADQPAKECEITALGSHPSNPQWKAPESPLWRTLTTSNTVSERWEKEGSVFRKIQSN